MNKSRSFTLIELLIASSIFAVVMVALYAAFSSGVFGYRNIDERVSAYQQARQAMGRINRDIRNSYVYSSGDVKFGGTADKVSFMTLVDDYSLLEIVRNMAFVSYYLEGNTLMRLCRRGQESLKDTSQAKADEMSFDIDKLTFTYIYEDNGALKEADAWDSSKKLPVAVMVKLSLKKKSTYDFERTIYLENVLDSAPQENE
jgi:type II secretion system protein J